MCTMNIAFFTETYFPQINGVTYTIDSWRKELERRGHKAYVVYPESGHDPEEFEVPIPSVRFRPVDGYHIGMSFPSDIAARMPEIDVVHAHGQFSMGIMGTLFAKRIGAPFILSYHSPGEQYFDYVSQNSTVQGAMDKIYLAWQRLFARRCDAILSPTPDAATRLARRMGKEVSPMSNGINTKFFSPADQSQVKQFKKRHGIEEGPVVGYCGRLGYEKRLEDLVAFAERFDGEIIVAGEGFARDHYLPMFEEAGIQYLGRLKREEMPTFYSALDAFVIPSIAETQGISVLEANACGTPAVGADARALQDTIKEGKNGYRYTAGNIEELDVAVKKVLKAELDPRSVVKEHSVEGVVDSLEQLYDRLAEKPVKRASIEQ